MVWSTAGQRKGSILFFYWDTDTFIKQNPVLSSSPKHHGSGREVFKDPATCWEVTPRLEKNYEHSSKDPPYILGNVVVDSIIIATARKRANIPTTSGPPPYRESKRIEMVGNKFERGAATQWRITNSNALLNR